MEVHCVGNTLIFELVEEISENGRRFPGCSIKIPTETNTHLFSNLRMTFLRVMMTDDRLEHSLRDQAVCLFGSQIRDFAFRSFFMLSAISERRCFVE